jgi:hypothetical protein
MNFIDEHCLVFDDRQDEGELRHTVIHAQFTEMVESLLSAQLSDLGLAQEDFAAIVMSAGKTSPLFQLLATHLLALDDFQTFKRMMNKRNLELELQAIQSIKRTRDAIRPAPHASKDAAGSPGDDESDEEIRRAIELSQVDAIAARRLAEMEESVMEAAIAESLLLEVLFSNSPACFCANEHSDVSR